MPPPPAPGARPSAAPDAPTAVVDIEDLDEIYVGAVGDTPDPLRVLLLEDDPDHAALVEAILADVADPAVYLDHVGTVAAATDALRQAHEDGRPYHAVLADQHLPDSAYWETVTRVVAAAGDVPVVALTSLGDLDVALDAVRAGAQDYLVKTDLTPELLRRTLRYAVERARRDAALRSTNEALRRTLHHVRQMQAQLIEQEKLAGLGRLLSGIAHELRNPLGLAVNSAEAALHEADALAAALGPVEGAVATHLETLRESAGRTVHHGRRADGVVRSMYEHARGVNGPLHPVRLGDLLRAAVAQTPAPGVDLASSVETDLEVPGVGSALVRMLSNLLDNAVTAARSGGGHVRVGAHQQDGPAGLEGVLTVEDDGPGLDAATAERAFEPFFSGWASGPRVGLGLPLAQAIAVGHGGRVELADSPLGGTSVRVVLPQEGVGAEPVEGVL